MRYYLLPIFCFFVFLVNSQNQHEGIIWDADNDEPVEFVGVYNSKDYTMSNADGRFLFSSSSDSVTLYRIGYSKIKATFEELQDTIYLTKSPLELDEIVVTNAKGLWDKIKDSLATNYKLETYKERFLLRCMLRNDDTIVRIQDIQGKLKRKTLFYTQDIDLTNKDFEVELTNMRKIGITDDADNVYFIFPSFYQIFKNFTPVNATNDSFILTESAFENEHKIRLEFKSDPNEKVVNTSGYYIINTKNNAIESFYLKSNPKDPPYSKNKFVRYRTVFYEVTLFFQQNEIENKYYLSSGKFNASVETTNEEASFSSKKDIHVVLHTYENFGDFKVKSNVNEKKDLFKIKFPYDEDYWNSENQLLLTDEMLNFIKRMDKGNEEFKIKTNMKK